MWLFLCACVQPYVHTYMHTYTQGHTGCVYLFITNVHYFIALHVPVRLILVFLYLHS